MSSSDKKEREERIESGYYIYGLIDPQVKHETDNDLLSVFYVGKGKGNRWKEHAKEIRKSLEEEYRRERDGSKAERIRKILDSGQEISALRLSAGYLDEHDAYAAEAMAIDTINALLRNTQRPELTNATPGHYAGFVLLRDHFFFTQTQEYLLDDSKPPTDDHEVIFVKGTVDDSVMPGQRFSNQELPPALNRHADRIRVLEVDHHHAGGQIRRGWNALNPWNDTEARERARRYWPIAADRVAGWLDDPATMPRKLLLGIPSDKGETVIRYVWDIDPERTWEYFPDSNRWGVPLGERDRNHPQLGSAIYENRDGRRVQALLNYSAGIRILKI